MNRKVKNARLESVIFGILFVGSIGVIISIATDQSGADAGAAVGLGISTVIVMSILKITKLGSQ